jgi:hypothetical protein
LNDGLGVNTGDKVKKDQIVKNNKRGTLYKILGSCIDVTNIREGTPAIIYTRLDDPDSNFFVRELDEFNEKFSKIDA